MIKLLLPVAILFMLSSCCNTECDSTEGNDTDSTQVVEETNVVEFADFNKNVEQLVGEIITMEGVVTHVCRHSGDKMYMMDENSEFSVKLVISDQITSFDTLYESKKILVEGIVEELVIDSAYIANWEQEILEEEESKAREEAVHADGTHETDGECDHHSNETNLIESYKKQIENNEGEPLIFYSLSATKIEEVE